MLPVAHSGGELGRVHEKAGEMVSLTEYLNSSTQPLPQAQKRKKKKKHGATTKINEMIMHHAFVVYSLVVQQT